MAQAEPLCDLMASPHNLLSPRFIASSHPRTGRALGDHRSDSLCLQGSKLRSKESVAQRPTVRPWITAQGGSSLDHPCPLALKILLSKDEQITERRASRTSVSWFEERFPCLLPKSGFLLQAACCWPPAVTFSRRANVSSAPLTGEGC